MPHRSSSPGVRSAFTAAGRVAMFACASLGRGLPIALGACALAASVAMAPEPDPVPRRWQLSVEVGPLRTASVETKDGTRAYFYLTYKVTNASGQDLLFTPSFDLVGDNGEIQRAGRHVPAEVTKDILARLDNPFMQDQVSIVGVLLQGESNAKEGVVVWPVTTTRMTELSIFASGFSGETRPVELKNEEGALTKVLLRKTLMLSYQPPGELREMGSTPLPLLEKQWVMR